MRVRNFLVLAMFALALSALSVSWASDDCTGSDLISYSSAQCLGFTKTIGQDNNRGSWEASTSCADYGDVVAMIVSYDNNSDTTPTKFLEP